MRKAMDYSKLKSVDIVDVVGKHVALRRRGSNYWGLCPFHNEKTPSFSVSPAKGMYHCFGCGANGDALDFTQAVTGLEVQDAAIKLAKEYGVDIGSSDDPGSKYYRFLGDLSLEFNRQAFLVEDYLASRGITAEDIKTWRLGYAGTTSGDPVMLRQCGLLSEKGYFLVKDRLIFPIMDRGGRVISLAGRLLPDHAGPKYINGAESPVYVKRQALYGINQAARSIVGGGVALLVEGYTDVIALHRVGIKNAVASCGTGITDDHLSYLASLCTSVVVATDPDPAGIKAALSVIRKAPKYGLDVMVKMSGEDPADLVQAGADFESIPEIPGYEFLRTHTDKIVEEVGDLLDELISSENILNISLEIKKISRTFEIPITELMREFKVRSWKHKKSERSSRETGTLPTLYRGTRRSS